MNTGKIVKVIDLPVVVPVPISAPQPIPVPNWPKREPVAEPKKVEPADVPVRS